MISAVLPLLVAAIPLLPTARASEPSWVETYTVPATSGPPADTCESAVTSASPGAPPPATPTAASSSPAPGTESMLRYDTAPGALNEQLPDPLRAALQLGSVYDLSLIPPEPLRGASGDIAWVKQVIRDAEGGRRHVRISVWGASHVAGEFLTGELRRMLQTKGGDGGHGFVMPAAPWKGYRASDVNLCTRGAWVSDYVEREGGRHDGLYGPGGMSVEASANTSSGWIQTTTSNPQGHLVSRFEVMFLKQARGGHVDLVVDSAAPIRVATDGSGPGLAILRVQEGPHRLTVTPAGDGPVRLFGVNMERDAPGVVVDAAGIVGRTAVSWLQWDLGLQRAYLDRRPPDLAVLAYGTNEANDSRLTKESYAAQLRTVLTRFRAVAPNAACLLVGPSDRGKKLSGTVHVIWSRTEWVAAVQREVGPEFGCAAWDVQAATGGPGSVFRWRDRTPSLMAADLIHFTSEGYKEVARRMLGALER